MSLAELVEEQLAAEPGATVTAVDIRIGTLSSIVPEALQFAWEPVAQGRVYKGPSYGFTRRRTAMRSSCSDRVVRTWRHRTSLCRAFITGLIHSLEHDAVARRLRLCADPMLAAAPQIPGSMRSLLAHKTVREHIVVGVLNGIKNTLV